MDTWPGHLRPDRSLRVLDDGRVLVGGSPLTVLRFAEPVDLDDVHAPAVVARLVDLGMAHPVPAAGPFIASDVTAVIPTYDEPVRLQHSLDALATEGTGVAEVIVVDDGSRDPSAIADVVARGSGTVPVRLVRRSTNAGPAAARNLGLAEVTTPLVVFLDAGCAPTIDDADPATPLADRSRRAGWLDPLLAHFADPTLALVAPRVVAGNRTSSTPPSGGGRRRAGWMSRVVASYEAHRSPLDLGTEPARVAPRTRVPYVPTACVVARGDALRAVGGFDETLLVGEDVDLEWRLGEATPPWRVRFEPATRVVADTRTRLGAFLRRRVDYGTSAAPLARRHPGALAPVSVSPWSATVWGLVAVGAPTAGLAVGGASIALLARRLAHLPDPWHEAARLAGVGNLAAGRLLADATRRVWWPMAGLAVAVGPRPLRRAVTVAFVVPPLVEWWRTRPEVDPASYLVLHLADDLAYGAGVWIGCLRERTIQPLLPDLRAGRVPRSRVTTGLTRPRARRLGAARSEASR